MENHEKTKEPLLEELSLLRHRVATLESVESERKRGEDAAQENEKNFCSLFRDSSVGTVEEALLASQRQLERQVAEPRLDEARLEALLRLSHMTEASLQEITDFALDRAVVLTRSKIGYLAFMNEDETVLTMHSWSKEAMAECAVSDKPLVYPLETVGLWGEAARQRKPIVTNDYAAPNPLKKRLPKGHVELSRHMNVPVLDGRHVVIVAGVGNKDEDYDESDVRQLTLLMEGMWMLIQRQRVHTELQQHRDHLEQLVKERTEALRQSHDELQTIYNQVVDGIIIVDAENMSPLRANAAYCNMLGYSAEEAYKLSPERVHPPDALPAVWEHLEAVKKGLVARANNLPFLHKDGSTVYADVVSSPIYYNERPCCISFFHNVTERKAAEETLQKEHRTLKHLLQSSDHERQLIAYEIHDELAQQLTGAIMQLETFNHMKETKPKEAMKLYDAGMALLRQGHAEARRLISGVRPPILDEEGVVAAVAHLVNEQNRLKGPKIVYRNRVSFDRLAPIAENTVYRIVQEGLTNACRHSKSKNVRVELIQHGDDLRIRIQDWGIGFVPEDVEENRFGLAGIRERARLLGGTTTVKSTQGQGSCITVELPLMIREG